MIRDFTSRSAAYRVDVAMHPAYDLLVAMWVSSCSEPRDSYELGASWFDDFDARLTSSLRDRLGDLGEGEVWIGLVSLVPEVPEGGSIAEFIAHVASVDPIRLRLGLINLKAHGAFDPDVARAAAAGDPEAIAEVLGHESFDEAKRYRDTLGKLLEMDPDDTRATLAGVMRDVHREAFSEHERSFRPALERDAAAKRALRARLSPDRLVEVATNGIAVERGSRKSVLLVPSVVIRPWVLIAGDPDTLVLCYPVAAEYLDADPDAPPEWLINRYKALGDDRRLRILRRLASGPATLHDLMDHLDLAKSTIHHHLMLLRSAGLIKVTLAEGKQHSRYSLRKDVVPETSGVLQEYIESAAGPAEEERS